MGVCIGITSCKLHSKPDVEGSRKQRFGSQSNLEGNGLKGGLPLLIPLHISRAGFEPSTTAARAQHLNHSAMTLNCIAYSILSVAETRDRALSFSKRSGLHDSVSHCLPHQWCFYCDTCRI